MTLSDRVAKLERDRPAASTAEFSAAMDALAARALAKMRGDAVLPPEPPDWLLAEINRRVTPADVEASRAKLLVMLERKAAAAKVV